MTCQFTFSMTHRDLCESSPTCLCCRIVGENLFSYSSLEAIPIPLIVPKAPHHIFSVLPYSVWTEADRTVHCVHYTTERIFTIKYQFSVLSKFGVFFTPLGDPWVDIFLQLFTISLIFHSQVALSPSRSCLNSTCVPMQYLTPMHTSSSTPLPSCSLLRHPPGAPCIWPHLFHPEQSFLSCSLFQAYSSCIHGWATRRCRRRGGFLQSYCHWLASTQQQEAS